MPKPKMQPYVTPDPPLRVIAKFFGRILAYPFVIVKKYQNYNIRIGEMKSELKDDELDRLRTNNGKLTLLFVYLPIVLGILLSGISVNAHKYDYQSYWHRINRVDKTDGLTDGIEKKYKKVKIAVTELPVKKYDIMFIIYGYLFTILGARFLSLNPVFKEEEKITSIFASLGYIDADGNPWQVTWTPDAIQIISFNCDPLALCQNTRFWSTINFPPSLTPKISKTHMGKFIVTRAYELTPNMIFSYE
jgi:hypothetical protein